MSYINEALKKAQEEKDSHHEKYFILPEAFNSANRDLIIKFFLCFLSFLLLIFLIFSAHLWLDSLQDKGIKAGGPEDPLRIETTQNVSDIKELYDKAISLYKIGKVSEAKELYEAILTLDPGDIEALNNLGIIYIREKDFEAARANLGKAVRLDPSYVDAYYNLACLYAIKGENDQGIEYLKKAVSLDNKVKEWAINDSDLKNIKASDEFYEIISQ